MRHFTIALGFGFNRISPFAKETQEYAVHCQVSTHNSERYAVITSTLAQLGSVFATVCCAG
jgi:hypothetical protein